MAREMEMITTLKALWNLLGGELKNFRPAPQVPEPIRDYLRIQPPPSDLQAALVAILAEIVRVEQDKKDAMTNQ